MNKKELEKYIATRPSAKESDGAWKRFVESNKLAEKETPKQTWERLEKEQQHPQDKYFDDKMKEIDKKGTSYLAKHLRKDPPIMERRGQQSLALNKIGKKVLDEGSLKPEDVELKLNENGLHTNKDRTIAVRDSFVANAFNKALGIKKPSYPTQATPKQFGELAERLERNRQQQGKPTNVKKFANGFNKPKYPGMKTWEKKKVSTPIEPVKIDLRPTYFPPVIEKDPKLEALGNKVFRDAEKGRQEQWERANSGIAGIMRTGKRYV